MILTWNNFVFNCTHYLQTISCAMGTICAISYANIVMANFEAKRICPYLKEMSLLYLRYIDDIFMIREGTKAELMIFIKDLNENTTLSNLTFKFHQEKSHFLTQCYTKTKIITFKQLYITNLRITSIFTR